MLFEYFFVKGTGRKGIKIIRALAPNATRATAIVAQHYGLKPSVTSPASILQYLESRRIREAAIENVFDPHIPHHATAPHDGTKLPENPFSRQD
jgi:hypothetical protein